jgi:menaquinone-dependent protoporphyrinogen oxidase
MTQQESDDILVVYTSWTGATREVAEAVAETFTDMGMEVDLRTAAEVRDVAHYHAVVIGNAVHGGKLDAKTLAFARRHARELAQKPVALFLLSLTMATDTPENRATASAYLEPLREAMPDVQPVGVGLFAGAVLQETEEAKQLGFFTRFIARQIAKSNSDHRDWDAIECWARALCPKIAAQHDSV